MTGNEMSLHIVPLGHRKRLPANKTETFDLWKITLPPNHDEFFFAIFRSFPAGDQGGPRVGDP